MAKTNVPKYNLVNRQRLINHTRLSWIWFCSFLANIILTNIILYEHYVNCKCSKAYYISWMSHILTLMFQVILCSLLEQLSHGRSVSFLTTAQGLIQTVQSDIYYSAVQCSEAEILGAFFSLSVPVRRPMWLHKLWSLAIKSLWHFNLSFHSLVSHFPYGSKPAIKTRQISLLWLVS